MPDLFRSSLNCCISCSCIHNKGLNAGVSDEWNRPVLSILVHQQTLVKYHSQAKQSREISGDLVNNIKRDGIVGHAKETLSTSLTYSAFPLTWGSLQSAEPTSWAGVIFHSLLKFSSSVDPGASWVLCFRRDPLNELDLNLKLLFRSRPLLSSSSGVPWRATLEDMLIEAVSVYGLSVKVHLHTYYLAGKGAKQSGNVWLRTHNLQKS